MDKALKKKLKPLLHELLELLQSINQTAAARLAPYADYYPKGSYTKSACNLADYLGLREHDLLALQSQLARLGFSSLGRGGGHVINSLERVTGLIGELLNISVTLPVNGCQSLDYDESVAILSKNVTKLLGECESPRKTRIMVTLASDAAFDYPQVLSLIEHGMNCARINCAHDDEDKWRRMVKHIRHAEKATGKSCRILMDMAGHKIRTGAVELGPAVRHLTVERDSYGITIAPCIVVLMASTEDGSAEGLAGEDNRYTIPTKLHKKLAVGDRLQFHDSRGKLRYFDIVSKTDEGHWMAHCDLASYLLSDCSLNWMRAEKDGSYLLQGQFNLGSFPGQPLTIRLFRGEPLMLTRTPIPGIPARYDRLGNLQDPARIPCSVPEVIDDLEIGDPLWIDDGKIGLVVEGISDEGCNLRVEHADPKGVRLQGDKGINCPQTHSSLPSLSEKDLSDLDFICHNADMVGFSFVETVEDIDALITALGKRKAAKLPIIAKIETASAMQNLPELLLTTIGRHPFGVMIARGDLSVEVGSVKLAEYQEEILWLCEAAHVPVIWATQVLETLAKKGRNSRPEFTDAAMGDRAECVMLNKGPFILDAMHALNQVLLHMEAHQEKRFSLLPSLMWRTVKSVSPK